MFSFWLVLALIHWDCFDVSVSLYQMALFAFWSSKHQTDMSGFRNHHLVPQENPQTLCEKFATEKILLVLNSSQPG